MRLKKYKNGDEYIVGGVVSIEPLVDYEPEVFDLDMTKEELTRFIKNKNIKSLRKKMRKAKNG